MFLKERGFWGALALVGYACLASANATGWSARALPLAIVPVLLALAFRATGNAPGAPESPSEGARPAARATLTGALVLAAALVPKPTFGVTALAHFGAAVACVGGIVAALRAPAAPGSLVTPARARRLDAAVAVAFAWSVAIALPLFVAFSPDPDVVPALALAGAAIFAAVAALAGMTFSLARSISSRRFELGLRERLGLPLVVGAVVLVTGLGAAALELVRPERVLPIAATIVACLAAAASSAREADTVGRSARFALVIGAPVAAVALAAAFAAKTWPDRALPAVVAATGAAAALGLVAPRLSRRAAPEGHRWLDTLKSADEAAMSPDPESALVRALGALARNGRSPVALHLADPPEVLALDRSGHVRRETAALPRTLFELARGEPERILRRDALEVAAVRRVDARSALDWLATREIDAAVVVFDEDEAVGLLCISRADRSGPWTLEEIRMLRRLGDRLGAVVSVTAKLRRSWERERTAREAEQALAAELAETKSGLSARGERSVELLERMAQPARVAAYGPAARIAMEELERWAAPPEGAPPRVTLLAAPGIDALAYAAHLHLAGAKKHEAFVVVDGGARDTNDLMVWRSETASPLVKAKGGTIVIVDPELLPKLVQSYVGAAIGADTSLVLVVPRALDLLVANDQLEERFADAAGDKVVVLPTLASRPEDLRALALSHLTTLGTRFLGHAVGIDPDALALLLEHDWPGNEAELVGILTRSLATSDGRVIARKDLAPFFDDRPAVVEPRRASVRG